MTKQFLQLPESVLGRFPLAEIANGRVESVSEFVDEAIVNLGTFVDQTRIEEHAGQQKRVTVINRMSVKYSVDIKPDIRTAFSALRDLGLYRCESQHRNLKRNQEIADLSGVEA